MKKQPHMLSDQLYRNMRG